MTIPPARSFEDFRTTGLLWYINRVAFHPRGFALAFHANDNGEVVGWSMMGKGDEIWCFTEQSDEEGFRKIEDFLATQKMEE